MEEHLKSEGIKTEVATIAELTVELRTQKIMYSEVSLFQSHLFDQETEEARRKLERQKKLLQEMNGTRIRTVQFLFSEFHALFRDVIATLATKVDDRQLSEQLATMIDDYPAPEGEIVSTSQLQDRLQYVLRQIRETKYRFRRREQILSQIDSVELEAALAFKEDMLKVIAACADDATLSE
ncbi:hypothetical protein QCA50_019433 [Cerrena zonata]|uniref:Uncharacterized protein n=1 Tax=Cerrena zonata TaxID=2478898 RepID=A0AAW0FK48_9APHY